VKETWKNMKEIWTKASNKPITNLYGACGKHDKNIFFETIEISNP
jgi:hypothetical protein